jgi:energy-coupling factor transporter ATP-binding protein EcfA2
MKLDRLIFVNWGQLPPGSYDMGNLTLLTGETGSGKSTMLDGLQTAMTAFYKGITQYNSGQDETGQGGSRGKTRRDLESYIVGAEYSKFSRPDGAHGYVAAVFQPDKGEEQCKPFTAVVAASARVEGSGESRQARLESFALFIADGAELVLEDFIPDVEAGVVVPVESIGRQLRAKYPKVIEFHDKKMDYLCALYGRFRGKPSVPRDEAYQAAKAWVQSIAYRKIGSVHELVRDEILDFDSRQLQQDIERISSLMKEVANLRKEGARLQGNVERLSRSAKLF